MAVPRPSMMFLGVAEKHASKAARLRPRLATEIEPIKVKYGQPGYTQSFSNEKLVFDFLQEAMAAVVLAYTALDNFASEFMPADFSMPDVNDTPALRTQIEKSWGFRKRLTWMLPYITRKPNIETNKLDIWEKLTTLKELRDNIEHIHFDQIYTISGQDVTKDYFRGSLL
jgi:hypothetical protein